MNRYHREKQIFDELYKEFSKSKQTLVIPGKEINRYRCPSALPIYGKVFTFYLLGNVTGKKVLDMVVEMEIMLFF